jgi:hypothetical protein
VRICLTIPHNLNTNWAGCYFAEVASTPLITIVPANSSVSLQGNFTLVMADADIVGTNESLGQTRHWLVNGVTLTGTLASAEGSLLAL